MQVSRGPLRFMSAGCNFENMTVNFENTDLDTSR